MEGARAGCTLGHWVIGHHEGQRSDGNAQQGPLTSCCARSVTCASTWAVPSSIVCMLPSRSWPRGK